MKGVSPLIASVLLIAFTVSVAMIFQGWTSGITKTTTQNISLQTIDSIACSSAVIKIENVFLSDGANCSLIVLNEGGKELNAQASLILTNGSSFTSGIYSVPKGTSRVLDMENCSLSCSKFSKAIASTDCSGISMTITDKSKIYFDGLQCTGCNSIETDMILDTSFSGTGNTTYDYSSSGNIGTCYNMPNSKCNTTSGISGKGILFDGVDDYINISEKENMNITGSITLEAWIKSGSDNRFIVTKDPIESSNFTYPTEDNGSLITTNWTRVNITIDITSESLSTLKFNWNGTNYTFCNDSLILALNFNNNSAIGDNSTYAVDVSKYGNNGTFFGSTQWTAQGKYGPGIRFASVNDYINLSTGSSLDVRNELTLSLWVNMSYSNITKGSGGGLHNCILLSNGSAMCWGYGEDGELGNSANPSKQVSAVYVSGNHDFTDIEVGGYHTCGIMSNGSTVCWGYGTTGQLGNGFSASSNVPVYVSGNYNFISLGLGDIHSCGILSNGSALCWGWGTSGQLGNGSNSNSNVPVFVNGEYNFTEIGLGDSHSCGILVNGSAMCWGYGGDGELGNGSDTNSNVPVYVSGNHNFTQISAGNYHSCGILTNGSALCWGGNWYGQLGNGNTTNSNVPVYLSGNYNFTKTYGGFYHSCAILVNGSAMCWGGDPDYGGLVGNGKISSSLIPAHVSGNHNFTSLFTGYYHNCGILVNGSAMCWGYDDDGELGILDVDEDNDGNYEHLAPAYVYGGYNFTKFRETADTYSSCGILSNGSIVCWGYNGYLQFQNGEDPEFISSWPDYPFVSIPAFMQVEYNFTSIYMSDSHSCGRLENGSVLCWGYNGFGQLGNGNTTTMYVPVYVSGNHNFTKLTSSDYTTCGLLVNGSAMCWGLGSQGQIGNGANDMQNTNPIYVSGGYNFSLLTASGRNICGLLVNGSAMCWGNDYSNVPSYISGGNNFTTISGGKTTCGLLLNGSAMCWGYNYYGQLGNGTTGGSSSVPVYVSGNYNFTNISAEYSHICGILVNGSALCWGMGTNGELGTGNKSDSNVPVYVKGGYNFTSIHPAYEHTCGLIRGGYAVCWGDDDYSPTTGTGSPAWYSWIPMTSQSNTLVGKAKSSYSLSSTYGNILISEIAGSRISYKMPSGMHHIAVAYNGSSQKLYVDGIEVANQTGGTRPIMYGIDPFSIGRVPGIFDEVRMWNISLNASEIYMHYQSEIQKYNSTQWRLFMNVTNLSSGVYSYYAWANDTAGNTNITDSGNLRYIIVANKTMDDAPYSLTTKSGGEFLIMKGALKYNLTASGNINDDEWHHLAATYDGLTMRLYRDGSLVASSTQFSGELPTVSGDLWIGCDYASTSSKNFNGTIGKIRIYSRTLSEDEISMRYSRMCDR